MRDGVGFEKENAVANDTKSATTWRRVRDSRAFLFRLRRMRKRNRGIRQCLHWLVHRPPACATTHSNPAPFLMSKLYTKDAAMLISREGRYCERNPGGVSFTYNNPAARISLQSKLASAMQKTVDKSRRFSAWRRVRDSNPRDLSVYSISSVVYHWQIRGWSRSLRAALSNAENPGTARACGHSGPYRPETIRTAPEFK